MARSILIVGFSVTAEPGGFVEVSDKAGWPEEVCVRRVGIGGVQPFHLMYVLPAILRDYEPDMVVLEIATPGFRDVPDPQEKHQEALNSLLYTCRRFNVPVGMLDLPRRDIDPETDWVFLMHQRVCSELGLPHRQVLIQNETLIHDAVHPTKEGKQLYADVFSALVDDMLASPIVPEIAAPKVQHDTISLLPETAQKNDNRQFSRAGYEAGFWEIPEGEESIWPLQEGMCVVGLSFLRGPKSGLLRITGDQTVELQAYDRFCYYERFGLSLFKPLSGDVLSIRQLPGVPEIDLLKGEKDYDARIGYVGHLLIEMSQ
ncbi:MAG: hypothetical protein GJ677_02460 [Rhodobacteraceae bacterium]|nr:hypothetical protein [Paracoccaceae bacterium]